MVINQLSYIGGQLHIIIDVDELDMIIANIIIIDVDEFDIWNTSQAHSPWSSGLPKRGAAHPCGRLVAGAKKMDQSWGYSGYPKLAGFMKDPPGFPWEVYGILWGF